MELVDLYEDYHTTTYDPK